MPAAKKSSVKKSVKRPAVKKAPVKRATTVRTKNAVKSEWDIASGGNYKTFKRAKAPSFFAFRITDQTVYWAILGFMVLALGVWIVTINDKVQYLYDQIDEQNADSVITPKNVKY